MAKNCWAVRIVWVTISLFAWISDGLAQIEPALKGRVVGEVFHIATLDPLPGANVVLIGTTLGAASDENGYFEIENIPVGTYSIRASVIGFTSRVISDVVVNVARPADLKFGLEEASVELGEINVVADYFQKLPEAPLSTQFQSYEEIRRLPGSLEDVVRAISILPGVAQVSPGRNDLIVRGGAPSENLYVVDNLEVPNINHFGTQGASGGPLSFINLDFVDRTSFSTGGFGVRYGDKLSSVLNINMRDGRADRLGGKATVSASQFGLDLEGPVDEDGSFVLSARRSYLDFIFKAAGFGFVPEYWDFLGKGHYHLGKNDRVNILAIVALDNVKFFNDTEDQRYDNSRILGSDQKQVIGGVTWRHLFGLGFSTLTFGQSYVEYEYIQSDSLLNPEFLNSSFEHESSLSGDVLLSLSKETELSFGVRAKVVRFRSDIELKPFVTNFGQLLSVDALYSTTAFKGAAFGQISQAIGKLRLTAGLRGDFFDLISDNLVVAPRLSATYSISPLLSFSASVGRYYQSPSYIWLAAREENRELKYAAVNQYIAGIEHVVRQDTKISLEVYLKKYFQYPSSLDRPFLVMANTGAGFGGSEDGFASFGVDRLVSFGSGKARGVEFFVQKKLSDIPCNGTLSVSYNESSFEALDGVERPNSFDQRWIVNVGGGYVFNEKWEVSTKFRFATGRPYTPFGTNGSQSAQLYNSVRVAANHSLDVRVDRRWLFESWTLITYVDIQNIYNRKPLSVPRYDPRTGMSDETNSIGILPSIGVSAEF